MLCVIILTEIVCVMLRSVFWICTKFDVWISMRTKVNFYLEPTVNVFTRSQAKKFKSFPDFPNIFLDSRTFFILPTNPVDKCLLSIRRCHLIAAFADNHSIHQNNLESIAKKITYLQSLE